MSTVSAVSTVSQVHCDHASDQDDPDPVAPDPAHICSFDFIVVSATRCARRLPASSVAATTGLEPTGELGELLANIDVIVDATPKHIGAANKARYDAAGVK